MVGWLSLRFADGIARLRTDLDEEGMDRRVCCDAVREIATSPGEGGSWPGDVTIGMAAVGHRYGLTLFWGGVNRWPAQDHTNRTHLFGKSPVMNEID